MCVMLTYSPLYRYVYRELRARNKNLPDNRKMEVRIGINIGDVVQDNDRIYGDGVNIASRIESIMRFSYGQTSSR